MTESKNPPGIIATMNNVCATMHAIREGADQQLNQKLGGGFRHHAHFLTASNRFVIYHYAGMVNYNCDDFVEKNKDVLFVDPVELMQGSGQPVITELFPEALTNRVM